MSDTNGGLFLLAFSLMAKLEKADYAFCFTGGMAVLEIVSGLFESGVA